MTEYAFGGKWMHDLNQELKGSDRACAVLAGAIIDERLVDLIRSYLLPVKNTKKDSLLGRGAPIETFSSRIELARRLNLISEETRKALDWVRDIRNDAAHLVDFSISSDSYKDKIINLVTELRIKKQMPSMLAKPYDGMKGNFIAVIIMLAISLELEAKETKQTNYQPVNALFNCSVNEKSSS